MTSASVYRDPEGKHVVRRTFTTPERTTFVETRLSPESAVFLASDLAAEAGVLLQRNRNG